MTIIRLLFTIILLGSVGAQAEQNESRIALVIGNASYKAAPLRSPVNDAKEIATKLRLLGFTVIERNNLTVKQIGSALREFRSKVVPGSVALVFYAGHGIQVRDENYLPAVDAEIIGEEDVPNQSLAVRQVIDLLIEAKPKFSIVFLDASRSSPYNKGFRNPKDGLSRVVAPPSVLISFSSFPGSVVLDNGRKNSLYSSALISGIDNTTQPISQVLKQLAEKVKVASKNQQEPWIEGNIDGDFCLGNCGATGNAGNVLSDDRAFWESVKNSNNPGELVAYLDKFPNGIFSSLARLRIESYKNTALIDPKATTQALSSSGVIFTRNDKEGGLCSGQVAPDMPVEAAHDGVGGVIQALITISDGAVKDVQFLRGPKVFENAVKTAVFQYKCKTGANVVTTQEFNFLVDGQKASDAPRTEAEYLQRLKNLKGVVIDCPDCPQLVTISPGSFDMGSNDLSDAIPVHRVTLPGFLMSKTKITQGQWKSVMGSNPSLNTKCGDNCPVENVTWTDANEFAKRISSKTGKIYRLPSETEWEYAARAGSNDKWSFGSNAMLVGQFAWYKSNSDGMSHPVAQKKPNAFGLFDMQGNVWEWTADCTHFSYKGAPSDGSAWKENCSQTSQVRRGGSWNQPVEQLSPAYRYQNYSTGKIGDTGFRVVRESDSRTPLPPPPPPRSAFKTIAVMCPTQVPPEMPRRALQDGTTGVVKAQITLKNGVVQDVTILSGPRVFHAAVKAAIMQYQCTSDNSGVEAVATQEFTFSISSKYPKYFINNFNVQSLKSIKFDKVFIDTVVSLGPTDLSCRSDGIIYDKNEFDSFGLFLKSAMTQELQLAGKWSLSGAPIKITIKNSNLSTFPAGVLNIEFEVSLPNGKTVTIKETNKFSDFMALTADKIACERSQLALVETVSKALLNLYQNPDFAAANF